MGEVTTETTQTVETATEQGAASGTDQTTIQKQTDQTVETQSTDGKPTTTDTTTKPTTTPSAQERINRMYARLQAERAAREKAEAEVRTSREVRPVVDAEYTDSSGENQSQSRHLTETDVHRILTQKESQYRFMQSEFGVIERHADALNEDGTYNMNHPFVKAYVDIGRRNPQLLSMENGPELAEAMAEKELGISYTKGRKDEAVRLQTVERNAHVSTSTVASPRSTTSGVALNDVQRKIAARMGLTEQEYKAMQNTTKITQKNWSGGRKV